MQVVVNHLNQKAMPSGRFLRAAFSAEMHAFEGNAHVEWFEGKFVDNEADKIRRLGSDAVEPNRIKYKKFAR